MDVALLGLNGDDIIVGGGDEDRYRLDANSGNDVINDCGSAPGVVSADRLFIGAARENVSFEIAGAAGESLIVRNGQGQGVTIVGQWSRDHAVEYFEFADGTQMTALEVNALLLAGTIGADQITGTSGNDLIDGRGGADVAKGNYGDDTYVFKRGYGLLTVADPLGINRVRFGAGIRKEDLSLERRSDGMLISVIGTSDAVLVQGGRSYQDLTMVQTPGFARECYAKLAGIQPKDILVSIELRDGQEHTILRARDGSELTIPGAPNFGRDIYITAEDGTVHQVRQAGALLANVVATAGDDWLRGQTTGPWTSFDRPTPSNEFFDPGAGNDIVAGYGGTDTVRFGRGDGKDVLLDSLNMGPREDRPQTYTVSFKAGVAREDVKVEWAPDGSGNLRTSIIGTEDSLIVSPQNFTAMIFPGGQVVRTVPIGDGAEIIDLKALYPAATAGDDLLFVDGGKTIDGGAGNDTIYHLPSAGSGPLVERLFDHRLRPRVGERRVRQRHGRHALRFLFLG